MRLFETVRADLHHVQKVAFAGGDEYRIVRTKQQVDELQSNMAERKYHQSELDDRGILNDDLSRVRDYRAHHDNWR